MYASVQSALSVAYGLKKTLRGLQSPQPPIRSPPCTAKHPGQNTMKRARVVKSTSVTRILTIGTVSFLARMKKMSLESSHFTESGTDLQLFITTIITIGVTRHDSFASHPNVY